MNHLEGLIAEWLENTGYIVAQNHKVGRRPKGGWDGELDIIASAISKEKKQGVVAIFSSSKMRWIMLLFCVTWSVEDFFYLGGQMNVENLAGNQFINFVIVAFTEFPSVFIGEFLINKVGRRWSHVLCMVTATAFFVAILPISNGMSYNT